MAVNLKLMVEKVKDKIIPDKLRREEKFDTDEYNDWADRTGISTKVDKTTIEPDGTIVEEFLGDFVSDITRDHYIERVESDSHHTHTGHVNYGRHSYRHYDSQSHRDMRNSTASYPSYNPFRSDGSIDREVWATQEQHSHNPTATATILADRIKEHKSIDYDETTGNGHITTSWWVNDKSFESHDDALEYLMGDAGDAPADQASIIFHDIRHRIEELCMSGRNAPSGRVEFMIREYLQYMVRDRVIDKFDIVMQPDTFKERLSMLKGDYCIYFELDLDMLHGRFR